MKLNLKTCCQDKEILKHVQKILREQPVTKGLGNKLEKIIRFYEELELDLSLGGECIVELDKGRLDSIKERDKFLTFMNSADDV